MSVTKQAPIAAGVIRGIIYALTLHLNGASGGIDILAALIRKRAPHLNLMNIIFALNMSVSLCSYFVYGYQLEPVICIAKKKFIPLIREVVETFHDAVFFVSTVQESHTHSH